MSTTPTTFAELVGLFLWTIQLIIPLIFAVTLLFLVWKIVDAWILGGGDVNKVEEGKKYALIGVVALVVMSSVWGILNLLRSTLNF